MPRAIQASTLGIPYGRGKGIVFHDTRHSAATNLVASGTAEAAATTIKGHADPAVFKRYNVRRDEVQTDALARMEAYLETQRAAGPSVPPAVLPGHDIGARHPRRQQTK